MRSGERNKTPKSVTERTDLIFSAFEGDGRPLTFSDIARRTGLPKTTVYRTVIQLADLDWLRRTDRGFTLSDRIFRLVSAVPARIELREAALPFMQDLFEATHETVHLAVRNGAHALYVEKIVGRRQVTALTKVGGLMPLHCTAVGKVLLANADAETQATVLAANLVSHTSATIHTASAMRAELQKIRDAGTAYDREEAARGLVCVACPITSPEGAVIGAISVAGGVQRFRPDQVSTAVRTAAFGINRSLTMRALRADSTASEN
ncbi:IclR family transcriptional regulator [Williamsia limnetica]|uniref:IclR family transcriptional regulator n=1 Tax=Williamsia limnetica TaxID=882452 RepID=A0A318RD99_WILLI|nr:IclR family transcriptional regulator [Williamsia limnetica]PYE11840.1 IclR family transcriptional regulator [Williamsia limnetica]